MLREIQFDIVIGPSLLRLLRTHLPPRTKVHLLCNSLHLPGIDIISPGTFESGYRPGFWPFGWDFASDMRPEPDNPDLDYDSVEYSVDTYSLGWEGQKEEESEKERDA